MSDRKTDGILGGGSEGDSAAEKNVPSKFSYAKIQNLSCELPVMQPDVLPSVITASTPLHMPRRVAPAGLRNKDRQSITEGYFPAI